MPFLIVYACSGFAGLVYEVAWSRQFALVMGHSTAASSTVLAAFMGGLAMGAMAARRPAARLAPVRALRAYAGLEFAVAIAALLIPFALRLVTPLLARVYDDGNGGLLFGAARLLIAFVLLAIPAAALGATFPFGVRWYCREPHRTAGALYAANTIGAMTGAAGAGFVLLPRVGLAMTTVVGIACSTLAGIAAIVISSPRPDTKRTTPVRTVRPRTAAAPRPIGSAPLLAGSVLALTGFATMAMEVAWMRVFAMTTGPSTYAFAATVTVFIAGLALGSAAGANTANARHRTARLAIALAVGAIVSIGSTWQAGTMLPEQVARSFADGSFGDILRQQFLLAAEYLLPAAFAIGFAYPLGLELAGARAEDAARRGAVIYAVNTAGAVAGALVTGFILIPAIGLELTLRSSAALLLIAALMTVVRGWKVGGHRWVPSIAVAAGVLMLLQPDHWDRQSLASGPYKYSRGGNGDRTILDATRRAGDLLYYREGSIGTVSVKQLNGHRTLAIDGKVDASSGSDMLTQVLLAQLPLLLHPRSQDVAIVGLGSGVTVGSALTHDVRSVDVVELSPEVVAASALFAPENRRALDDRRTRLLVADGRTHLLLTTKHYDVIVSEPSNPWMAGVASLFTREFFDAARARLRPGGILCQWAHTYDMSDASLRSIVATFTSIFPEVTMWFVGDGDLLMLGSDVPFDPRIAAVATGWQRAAVAADLARVGATEPFAVWSLYAGGNDTARSYAGDAAPQDDDLTSIEFSGPAALFAQGDDDPSSAWRRRRASAVDRLHLPPTARRWIERGRMMLGAGAGTTAMEDFITALKLDPSDHDASRGLVKSAGMAGRAREAIDLLQQRIEDKGTTALWVALSQLRAGTGDIRGALEAAQRACAGRPPDPLAYEQLASIQADIGDADALGRTASLLQQLFPERAGTYYFLAADAFLRDELDRALGYADRTLALDPARATALNLRGAAHARLGQPDAARTAFLRALELDPTDTATYTNLGQLELASGNRSTAARLFADALALDPQSSSAREGLLASQ